MRDVVVVGAIVLAILLISTWWRRRLDTFGMMPEAASTLYVFRTHTFDARIRRVWNKLLDDIGDTTRVYLLYDDTTHPLPDDIANSSTNIIVHNEGMSRAYTPYHWYNWYNADTVFAMLGERLEGIDYSYVWVIEHDVFCDGSYKESFNMVASSTEDLIAPSLHPYMPEVNWNWAYWHHLYSNKYLDCELPLENRWKAFMPVCRVSKRFLAMLKEHVKTAECFGFLEVLFPSLVAKTGLTMRAMPDAMIGDISILVVVSDAGDKPNRNDHRLYHKYV
jgi:hypothetical protein